MDIKEVYLVAGGDYLDTVDRLLSDELVEKFVVRFLSDETFSSLQNAIAQKNIENAFRAAHTLKGLAKNLGFNDLGESASKLTELLRTGCFDGVEELFFAVETDYNKLISAISDYVKQN